MSFRCPTLFCNFIRQYVHSVPRPFSHHYVRVGQTPLHKASFMGHIGNIRQLLAASADINARTKCPLPPPPSIAAHFQLRNTRLTLSFSNGRTTYDMAAERLETLALPPLPQGESEERRSLPNLLHFGSSHCVYSTSSGF